jgi:hypothetical protein
MFAALVIGIFSLSLIILGGGRPAWTRWLAAPHLLIALFGLGVVSPAFAGSTLGGHHLAAIALGSPEQIDISTPVWHRVYALVHVAFFFSVAWLALRTHPRKNATFDSMQSPKLQT